MRRLEPRSIDLAPFLTRFDEGTVGKSSTRTGTVRFVGAAEGRRGEGGNRARR